MWAARFRAAARSAAAPRWDVPGDPRGFRDEQGHRRAVDTPFIAHRLGLHAGPAPVGGRPLDEALWWAVHDAGVAVDAIVPTASAPAPLVYRVDRAGIEVGTETELGAVHALWLLGRLRGRPEWGDRALLAAAWMLEHLEPDNGTGHPWAAHVFIELAERRAMPEAVLYAGALLHAAQATSGRPDALSGMILADAADELLGPSA